ncbi:response regulator transcription factor [Salmonella enterica]|nr:response regulator transcription factor [Salmonella enterica]EED3335134.1 response regulator transcription factor [Salmonella enterica subsp. enterica]ELJ7524118.1 response regulator transcription factor [Salmonella enterica]
MLVLTSNQYLKLGFEALIRPQDQCINGQIILFNVGERFYFLHETDKYEWYPYDLFRILTKGICFGKRDLDTPEAFSHLLSGRIDRVKNSYKKSSDELSRCEVLVLNAYCKGYSTMEIANLLNKSIKTVSTQKSRALRKLGMRNMQMLHRTMVQWHILTKELNSVLPGGKLSTDYRIGFNFEQ